MNRLGYFVVSIVTVIATVVGFIMGACTVAFVYEKEKDDKLTNAEKNEE